MFSGRFRTFHGLFLFFPVKAGVELRSEIIALSACAAVSASGTHFLLERVI